MRKALSLGAYGYIQKMSAATDLTAAIDAALAGRRFVSSSVAFAEPVEAPAPRRHEILFCTDDACIVDGFARFVAAALKADDAAIVLVTESHRARLLQELRAQGVDIDGAIARGICLSFDADVAPDPARFVEAIDAVRASRHQGRQGTSPCRVLRGTRGPVVGRRKNRGGGSARTVL